MSEWVVNVDDPYEGGYDMKIIYKKGYDPEEILYIDSVKADRTLAGLAWMILTTVDGQKYEATELVFDPNSLGFIAYLPENW